jgi:hypothetical protein
MSLIGGEQSNDGDQTLSSSVYYRQYHVLTLGDSGILVSNDQNSAPLADLLAGIYDIWITFSGD